jgi:hypothetical protein
VDYLRENIAAFIESYYNRTRLHAALGYKPPEEFEQTTSCPASVAGAATSFFRHREIYQSDVVSKTREPVKADSQDHRR